MSTKASVRLLSVLAVLVLILAACGPSLQEQIIGQWELYDQSLGVSLVFSFKEDGALTIWIEDMPLEGTYTWIDEENIKITMTQEGMSEDIVGKVEINDDLLMITGETGETDILTRVK
jgi:hypothetical protein